MDNQNNKKKRNIFLPIFIAIIILIVIITLVLFLTGVIDFSELGNDNTSRDETKEVDKKKDDSKDNEEEENSGNKNPLFTPIRVNIIFDTSCAALDNNGELHETTSDITVDCTNYVCVANVDGKKYTRNCTEENNNTEEPEQSEENNSSEDTEDKLEQENQDEEEEENSENENPLYTPIRAKIIFDTSCAALDNNGELHETTSDITVDCTNYVCVADVDGKKYTRSCLEE